MTAVGNSRRARRAEILKELGLTPLWRAKELHAPNQASAVEEAGSRGAGF